MKFGQWLSREARRLPLHKAPASLQADVLRELARRAARPWWQRTFLQWPLAARGAFLLATLLLIRPVLDLGGWIAAALATPLRDAREGMWLLSALGRLAHSLIEVVPADLLYGMAGFIALLYGLLMALGAIAYRNLHG